MARPPISLFLRVSRLLEWPQNVFQAIFPPGRSRPENDATHFFSHTTQFRTCRLDFRYGSWAIISMDTVQCNVACGPKAFIIIIYNVIFFVSFGVFALCFMKIAFAAYLQFTHTRAREGAREWEHFITIYSCPMYSLRIGLHMSHCRII